MSGGHGHGHGRRRHAHDHSTPHLHVDLAAPAESHREPLAAGAGRGQWLLLDAFSGIAGDMTIAALVDLGVPFSAVEDALARLPLEGYRVELRRAAAGAIGGSRFRVLIDDGHPERSFAEIDAMLAGAPLEVEVAGLARRIFRRLAEAEAEVHRIEVERVHFHEVGAVDAIVDIVGAAAALVYLGAEVIATPLPMGKGRVECRHGVLPLPPPAVVACLEGVPTYDAGIDAELVTPTGAAIVATAAVRFERWPSFRPRRIGWGCGSMTLPDRPNALRAVLGEPEPELVPSSSESHVVVEANVDDMTGELAAHAIEVLLGAGAVDAWAAPVTMKKGRPGLVLSALAPRSRADAVAETMLRETTSIGVRWTGASRLERPRRMIEVPTPFGPIPVKLSEGPYGPAQLKPEFEACAEAARRAGVSVREVIAAVLRALPE